jgi:hypothetical protein
MKKRRSDVDKELRDKIMDDIMIYGIGGYREDKDGNIKVLTINELLDLDYGELEERDNEG